MSDDGDTYDNLFDEFDDGFDTQIHNPTVTHRLMEELNEEEPAPVIPKEEVVVGGKRSRTESFGSSVGVALPPQSRSTSGPHHSSASVSSMAVGAPYAFTNFEDLWTQASETQQQEPTQKAAPTSSLPDDMAFGDFDDWDAPQNLTSAATASGAVAPSSMAPPDAPPTVSFLDNFKKWFPNAHIKFATPSIANVVSVLYLGFGVDLRVLCCSLKNIEYTNKSTPKAILKLTDPKCTAIIRNSGSVMLLGSASVSAARAAAELVSRLVRVTLRLTSMHAVKFRIRCIMARFDLQYPIRLDELALNNPSIASYEPESFCGCIVTVRGYLPSSAITQGLVTSGTKDRAGGTPFLISCSIYTSGKVTMTGAHSVREIEAAYRLLVPIIAPHARKQR